VDRQEIEKGHTNSSEVIIAIIGEITTTIPTVAEKDAHSEAPHHTSNRLVGSFVTADWSIMYLAAHLFLPK
jgi:hypothetical protein